MINNNHTAQQTNKKVCRVYFYLCLTQSNTECDPINADINKNFQTYAENSPSNSDRHWIFRCDTSAVPSQDGKIDSCYYCKNPNYDLEIYFGSMTNQFLTFTGDVASDFPIVDYTEAALWFLDKYMLRPALPYAPDSKI